VQQGLIHKVVVVLDGERIEGKRGWERLMERGKSVSESGRDRRKEASWGAGRDGGRKRE
jgi:hypothetical protein